MHRDVIYETRFSHWYQRQPGRVRKSDATPMTSCIANISGTHASKSCRISPLEYVHSPPRYHSANRHLPHLVPAVILRAKGHVPPPCRSFTSSWDSLLVARLKRKIRRIRLRTPPTYEDPSDRFFTIESDRLLA